MLTGFGTEAGATGLITGPGLIAGPGLITGPGLTTGAGLIGVRFEFTAGGFKAKLLVGGIFEATVGFWGYP